jgi:hypothetical protein
MPPTVIAFAGGLLFSVVVGHQVVAALLEVLNRRADLHSRPDEEKDGPRIPAAITGYVERLFFSLLVAFDVSGTPPAMIGWIAAKMLAHWNSPQAGRPGMSAVEMRNRRFVALLSGLVSLSIALVGGVIAKSPQLVGLNLVIASGVAMVAAVAARLRLRRAPVRTLAHQAYKPE